MSKKDKDYPNEFSRKEIITEIKTLSKDLMSPSQVTLVSQAGTEKLLRLGKIQLGFNELQNRQAKIVFWITISISFVSLLIAGTALYLSLNSSKNSQKIEDLRLQQNTIIIQELKSINNNLENKSAFKNDSIRERN